MAPACRQARFVTEKIISYQSSNIFYRTIGNGKPIILIHGFGEDGDIWQNQVKFLKKYFYLIIPDLPGSGRSDMINDMSMEGMAELIKELIAEEAPKFPLQPTESEGVRVCMLGHSMGGYISLAFAEKYPDQLSSFGLVHSSAFADNEEKKATRLKSIGFIKKHGAYEFFKSSIPPLFTETWAEQNQLTVDELVEKSKSFKDEAIIQYYQGMIDRTDRAAVLKNFYNPVLFIMGEHDKAVPFEQSMQQCYLPNQAHIHILRNSAHMGMLEEADIVNKAILNFINLI